jgi:hypothetical protein
MNEEMERNVKKEESYARLAALSSSSTSAPSFSYSINRRSASSTMLDKLSKRDATLRMPLPVAVRVLEKMVSCE